MKEFGWSEQQVLLVKSEKEDCEVLLRISKVTVKQDQAHLTCDSSRSSFSGDNVNKVRMLRPNSSWEAIEILSLVTVQREYYALANFSNIKLFRQILDPSSSSNIANSDTLTGTKIYDAKEYEKRLGLNEPQALAVRGCLSKRSGFSLINGPPGTGKTRTIVGLLGALQSVATVIQPPSGSSASSNIPKKNRLLVTAPSNAGIDEITRRLLDGVLAMNGQLIHPKIVRLGQSLHHSTKSVSLDALLEKELLTDSRYQAAKDTQGNHMATINELKNTLDRLHAKKDLLEKQESTDESRKKIKEISSVLYHTNQELGKLVSLKAKDTGDVESRRLALRKQIVRKCDIVLATLSGSGHDLVSQLHGVDFMTVIIDEACQAVETSSLIPLVCGAVKCILIGDPMQLPPTVLSTQGAAKKFNQSLFERILKTVGSEFLLSVQYRMHPELSLFPNKYFYNGKLSDAPYMKENRKADWHNQKFPPFAFYDVYQGEEKKNKRSKSFYNMHEIDCIIQFIKNLSKSFPNIMFSRRIGIISYYSKQIQKLEDRFVEEFGGEILDFIDINTVDGFQGQEKDIIILSCVRTEGIGFLGNEKRINVSITRARYSLYVFGKASALSSQGAWKSFVAEIRMRRLMLKVDSAESKLAESLLLTQVKHLNLYSAGHQAVIKDLYEKSTEKKRKENTDLPDPLKRTKLE